MALDMRKAPDSGAWACDCYRYLLRGAPNFEVTVLRIPVEIVAGTRDAWADPVG